MAQVTLGLHSIGDGFVGQIVVPEGITLSEGGQRPQMVLIMDNSGSMGQWSKRMLNIVFPEMLVNMGCHQDDKLLVILFSSSSSHHWMKVSDLPQFEPGRQGSTQMSGIYNELQMQLGPSTPCVQMLVLSDGAVHDQTSTADAAAAAAPLLKSSYQIEARAVRLFTSEAQPDTRALASVLQLNTDTVGTVMDLKRDECSFSDMAQQMAGMFDNRGGAGLFLRTGNLALMLDPWAEAKDQIHLRLGKNTFWLSAIPKDPELNGEPVLVQEKEPLTQDTLGTVLEDRLEYFVSQLKVLKVVDTQQAKEQIARIVDYFKKLEASLAPAAELAPLLAGGGLKNRATFICKSMQRRLRSVTTIMDSIANDDRVRALNQAQQADYLRQMTASKNSRALAKRAETAGTDFDETLRCEIMEMRRHIQELDEIDASEHSVSFYSQASTVDGIREVCAIAEDEDMFSKLLAVDLLRVFNVVGVPAVAPISDYPDPMTYRLDKLLPGCYISVADLSIIELAGAKVQAPGTTTDIINAIPFFEDLRVQRFLRSYAPTALEYICSIGMRRVLAEIPQTFPYTVCAAVWNLVERLDADKSELNVNLLRRMIPAYHESLSGRFEYLMPMLEMDRDPEKSFFISHNGVTNMISPIWRLVEEDKLQNMAAILRALYTFECFQAMRRVCKRFEAKFCFEQLDQLLGVDVTERRTPLPELFSRTEPTHCKEVHLDAALFAKLCEEKPVANAKHATRLAPFFKAVRTEDPVSQVREIPSISATTLVDDLMLDYPFEEFLLYNIVEGFLFQSKVSRLDKDTNKSLRPDLGNRSAGEKMVQEYISERYRQDYEYRLKEQAGEERQKLCEQLVSELVASDSIESFNQLLADGITRGDCAFKIANCNAQGCIELHDALFDTSREIPRRSEKLQVFYTGESKEGKPVWNGGNVYRVSTDPLKDLLFAQHEEAIWEDIQKLYKTKMSHLYRGGSCTCNRHGHSNDKPSYFAFGHNSLLKFIEGNTKEAWETYRIEHASCCKVCDALVDAQRLATKFAAKKKVAGVWLPSFISDFKF